MISLSPISDLVLDGTTHVENADELGFVVSAGNRFLTYVSTLEYAELANENKWVTSVLWDESLGNPGNQYGYQIIRVSQAPYAFTRLHNSQVSGAHEEPSVIDPTAVIHSTAWVSPVGVKIEPNVVIEANVSIFPNTQIGARAVIRSGAQIGTVALDIKETPTGDLITSDHLGRTVIMNDVEIGNNSVVDRAIFRYEETYIGEFTKIGSLVNISHGVRLGTRNKVAAGVQICGYTNLGDRNWVGPGVIVSHMLNVGSDCYLSLGSNVLQDIEDGWKVVGNKIFKDRKLF